jgi:hypothetical protein
MFSLTLTSVAWFADLTFFNLQLMSSKLCGFSGKKQFGVAVGLWNFFKSVKVSAPQNSNRTCTFKSKNLQYL